MICPSTTMDCDNPGCRHGGCQGRLPQLPLFQARNTQPTLPDPTLVKLYKNAAAPVRDAA